jgi:hypothetical protein
MTLLTVPALADIQMCADTGAGGYTCISDPISGLGEVFDSPNGNYAGVEQRIDGSDSEKMAIREILERMEDYYRNEVLAMPVYEGIRSRWYVRKDNGTVFLV